jgi:hypothetical protein
MVARVSSGIKAASGYPQYSGNLIMPKFSQDLIERFYCSTVFGEITTTEYLGEIKSCGDQITFYSEPCVRVRPLVKDGTIKHDTIESKPMTLTIDKAHEFSVKISMVDERQICNIEQFKAAMLRSAARNSAKAVDCCVLNSLYADVSRDNSGNAAGICSHCYNLGTIGAPLVVTKDNIIDYLLNLNAVLDEQCVPDDMRWIVVPPKFKNILMQSELRTAMCCSGAGTAEDIVLNGKLPDMIGGFNIYVSNALEAVIDPGTQQMAYNIVAGWKGAVAFASQIEHTRIIEDKDNWDTFYQGMMVYGFGTVRPEGLVHSYVVLAS